MVLMPIGDSAILYRTSATSVLVTLASDWHVLKEVIINVYTVIYNARV